jgi:RNA polymerase sigma factor (sigma-70 family)
MARESGRLTRFIRRRVADVADAEDILQEVFSELVESTRMLQPIEQVGAWLFSVARHRIIERFRKRRPTVSTSDPVGTDEGRPLLFEEVLPANDGGPDAAYARQVLVDELEAAIEELPAEQRFVFEAHELEGRSFKELAAETGLSVNTLLSRKHYAVRRLRRRLRAIHTMFQQTQGERT